MPSPLSKLGHPLLSAAAQDGWRPAERRQLAALRRALRAAGLRRAPADRRWTEAAGGRPKAGAQEGSPALTDRLGTPAAARGRRALQRCDPRFRC
jgi:hypothetical protein